jgi:aspartyl-tRNA(Asn)/glutamyl-tRNA(Gln) amidotransferase subunit A
MNSADDLHGCSVVELGRRLRSGSLNAVDLTEYFIERIASHADKSVFISTCFEQARKDAQGCAARLQAGHGASAWDGIPLVWKDNVDVMGTVTSVGSMIFRDAPPAKVDATVAAHARASGLVTLAKANMSEFAYTALGTNPHFGTPKNPCSSDVVRVPGGSSSGSAAAVAAGLAPIAIGTDTGGSVRTPAAFNGLVGFKPSAGRYDNTGVFPLSVTLDTVGFFIRHASDCWGLDCMLRGVSIEECPPPSIAQDLAGLSIVVPENVVLDDLEDGVAQNFFESIERLQDAGVRVERRHIPELSELRALVNRHGAYASAEAYATHKALIDSDRFAEIDPFVAKRIIAGKSMSDSDIQALKQGMLALRRSLSDSLSGQLLAMPTVPHVAPALAPLQENAADFAATNLKTIRNTSMGNLLNLCGLSLPNGLGAARMPTAILFNAISGAEPALLARAEALATIVRPLGV